MFVRPLKLIEFFFLLYEGIGQIQVRGADLYSGEAGKQVERSLHSRNHLIDETKRDLMQSLFYASDTAIVSSCPP